MIRRTVQDCWLEFDDEDAGLTGKFPVSSFTASFKLDTLPTLTAVPSIGRHIRTGKRGSLKNLQEAAKSTLWLKTNGEDRKIFTGYLETIAAGDVSTVFSRTVSATLRFKHQLVKLAGAPRASYMYTKACGTFLDLLQNKNSRPDSLTNVAGVSRDPINTLFDKLTTEAGIEVFEHPPEMITALVRILTRENTPDRTDTAEFLKPYEEIGTRHLVIGNRVFARALHTAFIRKYTTGNCWDGLLNAARTLMLHIVPYNDGAYIADPIALVRTPKKKLTSAEYTILKHSLAEQLNEPVDGVAVVVTRGTGLLNSNVISYPDKDLLAVDEGKYYYKVAFPGWLYPFAERMYGALPEEPVDRWHRGAVEEQEPPENPDDNLQLLGERIAKSIYGEKALKNLVFSLTLPYREDLMPGTTVAVENSDASDLSFIGDTLYGMVLSTDITCDMLKGSGKLSMTVNIGGSRNEKDNERYGFADHPFYGTVWPGCNLQGELLS